MLSPPERARYARQIMLVDVGEPGQAAIARATATVSGPLAARYAERAGFAATTEGNADEAWAPRDIVSHEAARDVLGAARCVLAEIRRVLDEAT